MSDQQDDKKNDENGETENDIPQPVFKDDGNAQGADPASGELIDPVFDDAPIAAKGEIPDPVFDDAPAKPEKRQLSEQELAELSATLPDDLNFESAEDGSIIETQTPLPESNKKAEATNPLKDDYAVDDMAFSQDDDEIETDNLKKGEDSELSIKDPALKRVKVAAGWDVKRFEGSPVDLDLSCFILNKDDMTRVDTDFVFYNNLQGADLAVKHSGDNQTGEGDGDDETITIDLEALPFDIFEILFVITIYQGEENQQNFGLVNNAFIRIVNEETNVVLARFDLTSDFSDGTCLRFGSLIREGANWRFHAEGEFFDGGLTKIAQQYGLLIAGT